MATNNGSSKRKRNRSQLDIQFQSPANKQRHKRHKNNNQSQFHIPIVRTPQQVTQINKSRITPRKSKGNRKQKANRILPSESSKLHCSFEINCIFENFKKFPDKNKLNNHMRTHVLEMRVIPRNYYSTYKGYFCIKCGKHFLKQHKKCNGNILAYTEQEIHDFIHVNKHSNPQPIIILRETIFNDNEEMLKLSSRLYNSEIISQSPKDMDNNTSHSTNNQLSEDNTQNSTFIGPFNLNTALTETEDKYDSDDDDIIGDMNHTPMGDDDQGNEDQDLDQNRDVEEKQIEISTESLYETPMGNEIDSQMKDQSNKNRNQHLETIHENEDNYDKRMNIPQISQQSDLQTMITHTPKQLPLIPQTPSSISSVNTTTSTFEWKCSGCNATNINRYDCSKCKLIFHNPKTPNLLRNMSFNDTEPITQSHTSITSCIGQLSISNQPTNGHSCEMKIDGNSFPNSHQSSTNILNPIVNSSLWEQQNFAQELQQYNIANEVIMKSTDSSLNAEAPKFDPNMNNINLSLNNPSELKIDNHANEYIYIDHFDINDTFTIHTCPITNCSKHRSIDHKESLIQFWNHTYKKGKDYDRFYGWQDINELKKHMSKHCIENPNIIPKQYLIKYNRNVCNICNKFCNRKIVCHFLYFLRVLNCMSP